MNEFPAFWTAPLGLFAGMLLISRLGSWFILLLTAIGRHPTTGSQKPVREKSKVAAVFAFLHPAPWALLIGVTYAAYRIYQHSLSAEWQWFVWSALVAIVGMGTLAVSMFRRVLKRAAEKAASSKSSGEHVV